MRGKHMKWTVTIGSEEFTDYDGFKHDAWSKTFEYPFECWQDVYYAYKENRFFRKPRWVIRKSKITGIWATNCFGVCLDNNEHIVEDSFDRLFTDKEAAIDFCLKKNRQLKVKIYNNR